MLTTMAILGAIWIAYNLIKEKLTPYIPAENWENQELLQKDILNPYISAKLITKAARCGRYKVDKDNK